MVMKKEISSNVFGVLDAFDLDICKNIIIEIERQISCVLVAQN